MYRCKSIRDEVQIQTDKCLERIEQLVGKVFTQDIDRILELVQHMYLVIPYRDSKIPGLKEYKDLLDAEPGCQTILAAWNRVIRPAKYYGVMLGRPSRNLIVIDIDDYTAEDCPEEEARVDNRVVKGLIIPLNKLVEKIASPNELADYIARVLEPKVIFESKAGKTWVELIEEELNRLHIPYDPNLVNLVLRKLEKSNLTQPGDF